MSHSNPILTVETLADKLETIGGSEYEPLERNVAEWLAQRVISYLIPKDADATIGFTPTYTNTVISNG